MHLHRLVTHGLVVTGLVAGLVIATRTDHKPPSAEQVELARETSDLLLATLFAALTLEFDETTVDNVEQGKLSISLVFNDANRDMRLVGTFDPLGKKNRPSDDFERTALDLALTGQNHTAVEPVDHR